MPRQMI